VTIGRPIDNSQVYILDRCLNPVPVGTYGDLYIGGEGLARGYLNNAGLTAENFLPSPFSARPGARLYKTGDRARYLPDGNIDFLGRVDNQVKIRGFRIELGEVEAALSRHPRVHETVVVAREDTREEPRASENQESKIGNLKSEQRLVAYVVPIQDRIELGELRAFLKAKLPDYMIPTAFVFLDSLPLAPNGKIDRRALPDPEPGRPGLDSDFVPPRTPAEELLANIWANVLKVGPVGVHDNFFALGGHSLLATRVISRLRDAFGVDLPLRVLFERPTIEELALSVEEILIQELESPSDDGAVHRSR
jgi:hypothetical protein